MIDCSLCACTYPGIGVLDVVHDTVRISVHIQVNAPAWDLGTTKCTSTGGGEVEQVMGCEVGGQKRVAVSACGGRGVPLYSVLNDIQDLRVHSHAIAW